MNRRILWLLSELGLFTLYMVVGALCFVACVLGPYVGR